MIYLIQRFYFVFTSSKGITHFSLQEGGHTEERLREAEGGGLLPGGQAGAATRGRSL